jgi:hypothetical protein
MTTKTPKKKPAAKRAPSRLATARAARRPVEPVNTGWGEGGDEDGQESQDETAYHLTRAAEEESGDEWSEDDEDDDEEDDEDDQDDEDEDEAWEDEVDGSDEDERAWKRTAASTGSEPRLYTAESYTRGIVVDMPSGGAFLLRPVSLLTLMRLGQLPNNLQGAAERMIYGNDQAKTQAGNRMERRGATRRSQGPSNKSQDAKDTTALVDFLVQSLVANVKIVNKPQSRCRKGELSIAKVWESDKMAIVEFAMSGQKELSSFREDA